MRFLSKIMRKPVMCVAMAAVLLSAAGCHEVNDDRIPYAVVSLNLSDIAVWHKWGVSGYGVNRKFIKSENLPAGYPYLERDATGFGGVLLIDGMDPYTGTTSAPNAYDLACPVERDAKIRVNINAETLEAVCPKCGSTYDVTMAGGAPTWGPAAEQHYAMKRYKCVPSNGQGYIIIN